MNRLIPDMIVQAVKTGINDGVLTGSVLFLDIKGFASLTDQFFQEGKEGAEILSDSINKVFSLVVGKIYAYNGFVSTFAGDALTAIFPKENSCLSALDCAGEIAELFKKNKKQKNKYADFELSARIGLAYAEIKWGIIGSDKQKAFYFQGEAVNGSAAAEKHCEPGQIVINGEFRKALQEVKADNIDMLNIVEDYYQVKPLKYKAIVKEVICEDNPVLPEFQPELLYKTDFRGEFREILSIFVKIPEISDREELNRFLVPVLDLMHQAGGYLNCLDFGDKGAYCLFFFGAPVSHDNNLKRSLEFIKGVKEIYPQAITVGINSGMVLAFMKGSKEQQSYACFGNTLNIAARLMSGAEAGQVLATEQVVKGGSEYYQFQLLGERKLKGMQEAVAVYEMKTEKKDQASVQFKGKCVGRQAEFGLLEEWSRSLQEGFFAGVTFIYGNAGIGKSRLIYEFAESKKDVAQIISLQADSIFRKSFNPFTEQFGRYFHKRSSDEQSVLKEKFEKGWQALLEKIEDQEKNQSLRHSLEKNKSTLEAFLGLEVEDPSWVELSPQLKFENTLQALKAFYKCLSKIKPLIMVIEDIHVLDSDSLTFINVFTRALEDYPIMLICTGRFYDDGTKPDLALDIDITGNEIILKELQGSDTEKMIDDILQGKPDKKLLNFIENKAEGNPFFTEQFCYYLQENRMIQSASSGLSLAAKMPDIPPNINQIIISRIDRLSLELKEAVQVASVLGMDFDSSILEAVLNLYQYQTKHTVLKDVLENGRNEKVWTIFSELKYIFQHALLREAAYEMQLRGRLKELHKLAAECLVRAYPDKAEYYSEIAWHYEMAECYSECANFYFLAGIQAKNEYKNAFTIAFLQKYLKYGKDLDKKREAIKSCAKTLFLNGRFREAFELVNKGLNSLKKNPDKIWEARFLLLLAEIQRKRNKPGKQSIEQAIKVLGRSKLPEALIIKSEAFGHLGSIYAEENQFETAKGFYKKSAKLTKITKDMGSYIKNLNLMGVYHRNKGNIKEAIKIFHEMEKAALEGKDKMAYATAVGNMGSCYLAMGNIKNASKYLQMQRQISEEIGDLHSEARACSNLGVMNCFTNNLEKGLELFQHTKDVYFELGDKRDIAAIAGNLGAVYCNMGFNDKGIYYFQLKLKLARQLNDYDGMMNALGNLGTLLSNEGLEPALKCLREIEEISRKHGKSDSAQSVYTHYASLYKEYAMWDKALEYGLKALRIYRKSGDSYQLAEILLDLAKILYNKHKYKRGMKYAKEGLELAINIGKRNIEFECQAQIFEIEFDTCKNQKQRLEIAERCERLIDSYEELDGKGRLCVSLWYGTLREDIRLRGIQYLDELMEKYPSPQYQIFRDFLAKGKT